MERGARWWWYCNRYRSPCSWLAYSIQCRYVWIGPCVITSTHDLIPLFLWCIRPRGIRQDLCYMPLRLWATPQDCLQSYLLFTVLGVRPGSWNAIMSPLQNHSLWLISVETPTLIYIIVHHIPVITRLLLWECNTTHWHTGSPRSEMVLIGIRQSTKTHITKISELYSLGFFWFWILLQKGWMR